MPRILASLALAALALTGVTTPQPPDEIVMSEWVADAYGCGDTTVIERRTITVTQYVPEGEDWVPYVTERPDARERALTADELASLDCEPPAPPAKPAPAPAPPKPPVKSAEPDNPAPAKPQPAEPNPTPAELDPAVLIAAAVACVVALVAAVVKENRP